MNLFPLPKQKFFDNNGRPLVGGLVFTYEAGTTTKTATYDDTGATNANPIVLDYRGECDIWGDPALAYKLTLAPATDTDPPTAPIWTVDNITVPGGGGGGGGTPGAPTNSIQYNNAGAFAGSPKLLYNNTTGTITFGIVNATATVIGPTGTGTDDGGNVTIAGGDADSGDAGDVRLTAGVSSGGAQGSAFIKVNNVDFIEVTSNGEVKIAGDEGATGDLLTSGGTGGPVSWTPAATVSAGTSVVDALSLSDMSLAQANVPGSQWDFVHQNSLTGHSGDGGAGDAWVRNPATGPLEALGFFTVSTDTAINSFAGFYNSQHLLEMFRKISGGVGGGFKASYIFGITDAGASRRFFAGVVHFDDPSIVTPVISGDPTDTANIIGLIKDSADSVLSIGWTSNLAVVTKIPTSIALTDIINLALRFVLTVDRGGDTGRIQLLNCGSGAVIIDEIFSFDSNAPAVDKEQSPLLGMNTGPSSAVALPFRLHKMATGSLT